ncbi:MAG TPA: hypothetical protein VLC97_03060 [Rhodanobacteraceae bacterium]|nr:hypothetical protein [Rhodanobacteraceae bacterium]
MPPALAKRLPKSRRSLESASGRNLPLASDRFGSRSDHRIAFDCATSCALRIALDHRAMRGSHCDGTAAPMMCIGIQKYRGVKMGFLGVHLRAGALPLLVALGMTSVIAIRSSDSRADVVPTYSIDFHAISAGGATVRNSCFGLSGTVGQAAPGYSSTTPGPPTYSVYAGFWSAAPGAGLDEIFFTGFEEC